MSGGPALVLRKNPPGYLQVSGAISCWRMSEHKLMALVSKKLEKRRRFGQKWSLPQLGNATKYTMGRQSVALQLVARSHAGSGRGGSRRGDFLIPPCRVQPSPLNAIRLSFSDLSAWSRGGLYGGRNPGRTGRT